MTLEIAQTKLALWLEAETAVASGQEYQIDTGGTSRRLKRADLKQVREQIEYWNKWVERLSNPNKIRLVVNRD
jgi:hypothetical protein